ncbi:hypothetical protein PG997_001231 [Apiospora hydei]|uniref:Uncharacterized protein n=1 Tax=Apiospora hydei TaxID=1337664 RepID=A0ABR1XD35_9PEZI
MRMSLGPADHDMALFGSLMICIQYCEGSEGVPGPARPSAHGSAHGKFWQTDGCLRRIPHRNSKRARRPSDGPPSAQPASFNAHAIGSIRSMGGELGGIKSWIMAFWKETTVLLLWHPESAPPPGFWLLRDARGPKALLACPPRNQD